MNIDDRIPGGQNAAMRAALRQMASGAPQGARAETAHALLREFRAHHKRRRRVRMLRTAALGACAAATIAVAFWLGKPTGTASSVAVVAPAPASTPVTQVAAPAVAPDLAAPVPRSSAGAATAARIVPRPGRGESRQPAITTARMPSEFMILPSFDPSAPAGPLQIVRLEMPGTDLNLIGIPVNEGVSELRVVADVMIAYDGRPYAMRVVRTVP